MDATFGFEKLKKGMKARVAAVLNANGGWLTTKEIAAASGLPVNRIVAAVRGLSVSGLLEGAERRSKPGGREGGPC